MWLMRKCSGQVHGMLSVWIRRDPITGHARLTDHCTNKALEAKEAVKQSTDSFQQLKVSPFFIQIHYISVNIILIQGCGYFNPKCFHSRNIFSKFTSEGKSQVINTAFFYNSKFCKMKNSPARIILLIAVVLLSIGTIYYFQTKKTGFNKQSISQTGGEISENQSITGVNPKTMSNKPDNQSQQGKISTIRLHLKDNVSVALEDLAKGSRVKVGDQDLVLTEPIAAKHKFALSDLSEGDIIYMYGIKVGVVTKQIKQGAAITTENVKNATQEIEKGKTVSLKWAAPDVEAFRNRTFMGYHRSDGQVGTANYWLVIPMVFCENRNTEKIREAMLSELGYQPESEYRAVYQGTGF